MLTQIILTSAAFAVSTGLKTCQSRTIALMLRVETTKNKDTVNKLV